MKTLSKISPGFIIPNPSPDIHGKKNLVSWPVNHLMTLFCPCFFVKRGIGDGYLIPKITFHSRSKRGFISAGP